MCVARTVFSVAGLGRDPRVVKCVGLLYVSSARERESVPA